MAPYLAPVHSSPAPYLAPNPTSYLAPVHCPHRILYDVSGLHRGALRASRRHYSILDIFLILRILKPAVELQHLDSEVVQFLEPFPFLLFRGFFGVRLFGKQHELSEGVPQTWEKAILRFGENWVAAKAIEPSY